jgi:putative ABC transport system permease protein
VRMVSTAYFETLGATIVRGRAFTDRDTASTIPVALVSQLFVDQYLRGVDPLRQRIELSLPGRGAPNTGPPAAQQIVGVFRTINNSEQLGDVSGPEIVLPFWQHPSLDASVAVRTAGNPATIRADAAAAVRTIDPNLPLVDVRTMTEIVRERLTSDRLNVALYGGLAAVALLLAALGVYGVMAFSVAQRTPEIGMRMALGAGQEHVRRLILREGAMLSAGGLLVGMAGAHALGRAMQSTLFGTGAMNMPVLLVVSAVLVTSSLLACYLPARRASAVDPMIALRQE